MREKGLLMARRNPFRDTLFDAVDDVMTGSIVEAYRTCGTPGCRCHDREKRGSYYLLTWSEGGRTNTRHIPREELPRIRRMTEDYQKAVNAGVDLAVRQLWCMPIMMRRVRVGQ